MLHDRAARWLMLTTACVLSLATGTGCRSMYYGTMEKFGYEKRDILTSRVKDARDDQEKAKQQFKTTLERFQEITNFNGGELEAKYKTLSAEYDRCQSRANDVHSRIKSVETVANDMFKEWAEEINQYQSAELRRSSQQKLDETKVKYQQLIALMHKSELKMEPVLAKFHDQVLYLKHNLNAAAIASLQDTAKGIDADVTALIRDMEASINEANAFVAQMK